MVAPPHQWTPRDLHLPSSTPSSVLGQAAPPAHFGCGFGTSLCCSASRSTPCRPTPSPCQHSTLCPGQAALEAQRERGVLECPGLAKHVGIFDEVYAEDLGALRDALGAAAPQLDVASPTALVEAICADPRSPGGHPELTALLNAVATMPGEREHRRRRLQLLVDVAAQLVLQQRGEDGAPFDPDPGAAPLVGLDVEVLVAPGGRALDAAVAERDEAVAALRTAQLANSALKQQVTPVPWHARGHPR